MTLRIGSLFSGAGGLDLAVEQVFGGETIWQSEVDPAASKVLATHWPGVPNLGDITTINWTWVEPADILCGGFPCQDVSVAAVDRRRGLAPGTRSNLWANFALAIAALQPPVVIIENVRGLLSAKAHRAMESAGPTMGDGPNRPVLRAAGAVLGDLADIGYDAQWATISAASVGSCHGRDRVVIVAHPQDSHSPLGSIAASTYEGFQPAAVDATAEGIAGNTHAPAGGYGPKLLPTPTTQDSANCAGPAQHRRNSLPLNVVATLLPTPGSSDGNGGRRRSQAALDDAGKHQTNLTDIGRLLPTPRARDGSGAGGNPQGGPSLPTSLLPTPSASDGVGGGPNDPIHRLKKGHQIQLIDLGMHPGSSELWGRYTMAIQRWEKMTRSAPAPTLPSARGKYGAALNPAFSEWMMGWPEGWVTAVPGVSRTDALRIIGNGVCPQQAVAAIRELLGVALLPNVTGGA